MSVWLALFIYFFPTLIAFFRSHNNIMPIFLINLLTGLSGLGWLWALVWSFTDNTKAVRVYA
ncbi:superinfection immunity protein [Dyadobacter psychrotolerans]|uniref:Superinfection immunity protein n=1 Tax=Dyadobacter psychrotolerans TaxID=2541721 RepID=A0A4R5DYA4_9BACT|nr:superinfection immunity protein [Dyadobacter psychrotolerans]TDE17704.1 superinfection immunity protein [Dyadobacter psychrotolerans]